MESRQVRRAEEREIEKARIRELKGVTRRLRARKVEKQQKERDKAEASGQRPKSIPLAALMGRHRDAVGWFSRGRFA